MRPGHDGVESETAVVHAEVSGKTNKQLYSRQKHK